MSPAQPAAALKCNRKPLMPTAMTLPRRSLALAVAMLTWCGAALTQDAAQKLPTIPMNAGMHLIQAEVAQTPEQRSIGLMHRPKMGANEGMLFVFESPAQQCFWMKNTLLPLSIAFLADDGQVVNIEDMAPHALNGHCSKQPVRFALEMNQGWFAKRGIKPGSRVQGGPLTK
jgi:uncharacterized membrane protein (UPF0127 family)